MIRTRKEIESEADIVLLLERLKEILEFCYDLLLEQYIIIYIVLPAFAGMSGILFSFLSCHIVLLDIIHVMEKGLRVEKIIFAPAAIFLEKSTHPIFGVWIVCERFQLGAYAANQRIHGG